MPGSRRKQKANHFYCGTSNVELPVPNKSFFPEEFRDKSRLNYYASLFNTVEINSSFYRVPMRRTVEKWAADVPDHFRFTFKLWKGITHARELSYEVKDLYRFMDAINGAGNKKGCLLIQFPASIKRSYMGKLARLLNEIHSIDKEKQWKVAVEFRDRSWYIDKIYELLADFGASVVMHDMPKSAPPWEADLSADLLYLRYHGERGDYRGSYDDQFLRGQSKLIKEAIRNGKTVFAYFNNTIGDAVGNAMRLSERALQRHK